MLMLDPAQPGRMSGASTEQWGRIERWKGVAFMVGGLIFVADTALVAMHVAAGTEPGPLGQGLVGAAWTASFVGLLGLYPRLVERTRRLTQAAAVFAVLGAVVMAAMGVTSFAYAAGIPGGELGDVVMYFLPGVFLGIVLGFGLFAAACLRTGAYSKAVAGLLLLLPVTFLFNIGTGIAGFSPVWKILAVVAVLAVTKLAVGYLLQNGRALTDADVTETSGDSAV